ncbi:MULTISPECIES: hypothetical protein [Photorhabdus]|uniref:Uncharacterized protein n=1 Tax=Photorhabdus namnaonensis TaxID=1851568 RepID=A0A1B8YHT0_9GAMM|nr:MULTISPECIES: hypothetical protein [Photorhabdus]OCA54702.1 hypothetical protein Phpb_02344 [Photorhabdus namnaonensis]
MKFTVTVIGAARKELAKSAVNPRPMRAVISGEKPAGLSGY